MKPKVIINKDVHEEIMHYVNKSNFEVSGLGTVLVEKGEVLRVNRIILLPQENTQAHTEITAQSVAKAMYELREAPGELKFWWHSHVNMGVFWSSIDKETIHEWGDQGWVLATVFNKKNEMRSAFYSKDGLNTPWGSHPLFLDDLETKVEAVVDKEQVQLWDANYSKFVANKVYSYSPPVKTFSGAWNQTSWESDEAYRLRISQERPMWFSSVKKWYFSGISFTTKEYHEAIKADAAKDRPNGMQKKRWATLKQIQKAGWQIDESKVVPFGDNKLPQEHVQKTRDTDVYGLSADQRLILAENGWTDEDLDDMFAMGFDSDECTLICKSGLQVSDIHQLVDDLSMNPNEVIIQARMKLRRAGIDPDTLQPFEHDSPFGSDDEDVDPELEELYDDYDEIMH